MENRTNEAVEKAKQAVAKAPVLERGKKITEILSDDFTRGRFKAVLGQKAEGFISSILSAYNLNQGLRSCDPMSVVSAAMIAATLDLPINQNLGFAHLVPYSGRAQFQMGWKGFVQLAIRTGQYKTMNAAVVYEGELKSFNRITSEVEINPDGKKSDTVIGYLAFFRLINGFEKFLYMTVDQVKAHGKRYSQSYAHPKGRWQLDFEAMALKTVLKMLLSKYGILSIELRRAIVADQGVVESIEGDPLEAVSYPDTTDAEALPAPEQNGKPNEGQLASPETLPVNPVESPFNKEGA